MKKIHNQFDVAVIGGGYAGLTSVVELVRAGVKKVLLVYDDQNWPPASKAAQGLSAIKGIYEADAELFSLKLQGHQGFLNWLDEIESIAQITRPKWAWNIGVEENFETKADFRSEFGRIYRRDFIGAKNVVLSFDDPQKFAKTKYPKDFWIDTQYLLDVLKKAASALGVLTIKAEVTAVEAEADLTTIRFKNGDHVSAFNLVIAAGAGSVTLLPPDCSELIESMTGVAGYTFQGQVSGKNRCEVKGTSSFVVNNSRAFWGSTSEAPSPLAHHSSASRERYHAKSKWDLATDLLNKFNKNQMLISDISSRWGIRVRCKGRKPMVKKILPQKNIWLNTGYYKSGVILAWVFAQQLSKEILAGLRGDKSQWTSNHSP